MGNLVSIPFIAGQWSLHGGEYDLVFRSLASQSPSLRGSGRFIRFLEVRGVAYARLNPLHCGAVVASLEDLKAAADEAARLNPLHCGAVVASLVQRLRHVLEQDPVSIPFIAGQWSLRPTRRTAGGRSKESQSPSLRGSGRFRTSWKPWPATGQSQSPSLRGSGRFIIVYLAYGRPPPHVSIPFIAGQWSLQGARLPAPGPPIPSLNPLHCGAVVASDGAPAPRHRARCLNPLHCGAVVASGELREMGVEYEVCLNPLHCGAVVASADLHDLIWRSDASQSPSLRGSGRFYPR